MSLIVEGPLLDQIHEHGQGAYPEETAGFLLGIIGEERRVREIILIANAREESARKNRYLIDPQDYLHAELEAERRKLDVIGVFHSHPDHPNAPSEFDRQWALPQFSYLITTIQEGKAVGSRSWRLADDRASFAEEVIEVRASSIPDH